MSAESDHAAELMLDIFLGLAEGKGDDELIFVDGAVRSLAEHLNIEPTWDEIEPMLAGEFRRRYRSGKTKLAERAPGGDTA